jgi:hypothetical protein
MQSLPPSFSGLEARCEAEALLVAELAGGKTVLRRQHVGYPLHVTRAFQLDRMTRSHHPLSSIGFWWALRRRSVEIRSCRRRRCRAQPHHSGVDRRA